MRYETVHSLFGLFFFNKITSYIIFFIITSPNSAFTNKFLMSLIDELIENEIRYYMSG